MTYQIEAITDETWECIREYSDILRCTSARPLKRTIDRTQGAFLVEVGNSDSRGELFRRCVYVTAARSLLVTISDPTYGKYVFSWQAWNGIVEQELNALNEQIGKAVKALYPFTSANLSAHVENNPHYEIPKELLIDLINSQINLSNTQKRLQVLRKQTEKLIKGKQSFLMWRFYLAKWRGIPKYEAVDRQLIDLVSSYFINPKNKTMLMTHLEEGGEGLSDDTKRVLTHIRDRER